MSYTVEAIQRREEKTTKAGKPFTKYLLSLVGEDADVPFADFQNVNPSPGDTLDGFEIKDEGFGRELRKVGGNGARPRPGRSPEETKAIQRQHSQDAGSRAFFKEIDLALVKPENSKQFYEWLRKRIDWFEKDIAGE